MEKKQNSKPRSFMAKAAVAFLVSSSLASIPVILVNRAEDLSRFSCVLVMAFIMATEVTQSTLTPSILLFISALVNVTVNVCISYMRNLQTSTDIAASVAWNVLFSYMRNLQTPKAIAATVAIFESTVAVGLMLGHLLSGANFRRQSDEMIAHSRQKTAITIWCMAMFPPFNLCYKAIPLTYLYFFRQGSVGHSNIEKRIFSFVGQLIESVLVDRSSLESSPV